MLKWIKTWLVSVLGSSAAARVQALRFCYLLLIRRKRDPEMDFIEKVLQPGDIAIDVGANGGDWTMMLARRVGRSGAVYAFEADPYYAEATRIALFLMRQRNIVFLPWGLSDREEQVTLRVSGKDGTRYSGESYLERGVTPDSHCVVVALKRLDDLTPLHPGLARVKVLKCDVEGFERFVLLGAAQTIAQSRPVLIVEVASNRSRSPEIMELWDLIEQWNLQAYAVDEKGSLVKCDYGFSCPSSTSVNRILVPREREQALENQLRGDG